MKTVDIQVHEVTRVEGHGNIVLRAKDGTVEECKLEITEAPRFFEAMLKDRSWWEASFITCRICGICSVGHTTASLKATEAAMDVEISEQTLLLRKILFYAEQLQSHILHTYFLVAPDQFKVGSVIPLASTHPDVVRRALRLKKLANELCGIIAGRHVHPQATVVGGFTRIPTMDELKMARQMLLDAEPDMKATVELFAGLTWPDFTRETEYVALSTEDEYAFYDGTLSSSDGQSVTASNYKEIIHEKIVPHSTAKHAFHNRESYMVGALARYNLNHKELRAEARNAAKKLGLKAPCHNPYMISVAQVVECVHCFYEAIDLVDQLLEKGLKPEVPNVKPKAGRGVGLAEVPRGLLVHDYTYNERGLITDANCIIPTAQNLGNIDRDIRAIAPQIIDRPKEEIRLLLEMLVRAYDPCISCSVHLLDIKFV